MIFVTVGTHEQQFDRLIRKIDEMKEKKRITEDVFLQIGYSEYKPKYCEYKKMISFEEMDEYSRKSRIIITHGGPGSIMLPFKYNKVPIVVPRQSKYKEHVDDHQVLFAKFLEMNNKIIMIDDIEDIENYITQYNKYTKNISKKEDEGNTKKFNCALEKIINDLL